MNNVFIEWEIAPKEISIDWENTELTYNGLYQKPTATINTGVSGEMAVVSVSGEALNAGDYIATAKIERIDGNQGRISNYKLKTAN